mgnify:CR=1 FL=1
MLPCQKQISNHTTDIAKLEKNIKNAKKYEKALKNIDKGIDVAENEKKANAKLKAYKCHLNKYQ